MFICGVPSFARRIRAAKVPRRTELGPQVPIVLLLEADKISCAVWSMSSEGGCMIHRSDRLRPTMPQSTFPDSLTGRGAQTNHICGQYLSRANPRGSSLVTPRPTHVTNRSNIAIVRCRSIIWYLTCHFTSIAGQSAGLPCSRAIGSSIQGAGRACNYFKISIPD